MRMLASYEVKSERSISMKLERVRARVLSASVFRTSISELLGAYIPSIVE